MKIGTSIQNRRKAMGLTQSELAELCGLTPRSLQHYEENTREPSYEKLNLIATALGVTVAEMFEEPEEAGETVGERIRRYRKAAKLTQAELGAAVNAATITIQQHERGGREPKLAQLQAIAAALGVPLTALVDNNIRTGGSCSGTVEDAPPVPAAAGAPAPSLGQRIKETRIAAGLTQKELSAALGVTESFISQYESGKRRPKLTTLGKIAKALDTTVYEMIGDDRSGESQEKPTFSERLRALLAASGISQTELARRSGVSESSISHYLSGDWEAKQDAIFAIAAALGVKPDALLGWDGDAPSCSGFPDVKPGMGDESGKEVRRMSELDRFRQGAEEMELGDSLAILTARTVDKLRKEVSNLGDDCPGGAHRIEALSGILAAIPAMLDRLTVPASAEPETKEAAPVVATPGRQDKTKGGVVVSINISYLKEKMREAGRTPDQAAAAMGMNTATYYRKLKADGMKFTVDEMQKIIQYLNLTEEEASRIFFAETVA